MSAMVCRAAMRQAAANILRADTTTLAMLLVAAYYLRGDDADRLERTRALGEKV
ncbi:MAG: hypothetical protein ACPG3V_08045 [Porticoccaceae bacterium]